MFTVQALCFGGDHDRHKVTPCVQPAQRCIESIIANADWSMISDIGICLNQIDERLADRFRCLLDRLPVPVTLYHPDKNVGKYLFMRQMLADALGSHLMWFDDDSFLSGPLGERQAWWRTVADIAKANDPCMVGSIYTLRNGFRRGQISGICAQPWYTGKGTHLHYWPRFCQGAWWIAQLAFLRKWDFPFESLYHNGGDSILGELCHQQDVSLIPFRSGVAINADSRGRESRALRRGITTSWPWETIDDGRSAQLKQQEWTIEKEYIGCHGRRGEK